MDERTATDPWAVVTRQQQHIARQAAEIAFLRSMLDGLARIANTALERTPTPD